MAFSAAAFASTTAFVSSNPNKAVSASLVPSSSSQSVAIPRSFSGLRKPIQSRVPRSVSFTRGSHSRRSFVVKASVSHLSVFFPFDFFWILKSAHYSVVNFEWRRKLFRVSLIDELWVGEWPAFWIHAWNWVSIDWIYVLYIIGCSSCEDGRRIAMVLTFNLPTSKLSCINLACPEFNYLKTSGHISFDTHSAC